MNSFGSQAMVGELRRVVVSPPNESIASASTDEGIISGRSTLKGPAEEHSAFVCFQFSANVPALAPGRCLMVDGFPKTKAAIESRGCEVEIPRLGNVHYGRGRTDLP